MNFIAKKFYSKFQNSIVSDKWAKNFQSIGNDKINQLMKYIERSHWPRMNNFTRQLNVRSDLQDAKIYPGGPDDFTDLVRQRLKSSGGGPRRARVSSAHPSSRHTRHYAIGRGQGWHTARLLSLLDLVDTLDSN